MYFKRKEGKYKSDLKTRDIYNFYKEKIKDPLPYLEFSQIIQEVNKNCIFKLALTGEEFRLPYGLGVLYVAKRKINIKLNDDGSIYLKNLKVDWKKTKELWEKKYPGIPAEEITDIKDKPKVFYLNEHSNKYRMVYNWDRRTSNVKNQSLFLFRVVRTLKAEVAKYFMESGNTDYYELKPSNTKEKYDK